MGCVPPNIPVVAFVEGRVCKGGQNPPNVSTRRPPAPGGFGGKRCPTCGEQVVRVDECGFMTCESGHVFL
jgi:hypothetical protein